MCKTFPSIDCFDMISGMDEFFIGCKFCLSQVIPQVVRVSKCDRRVTGHTPGRINRNGTVIHCSVADCLSCWALGVDMAMSEGGRPHAAYDPVIDVTASLSKMSTRVFGLKPQAELGRADFGIILSGHTDKIYYTRRLFRVRVATQ